MSLQWVRVSVYTSVCEIEASGQKDLKKLRKDQIVERLSDLLKVGLGENGDVWKYLKALMDRRRVSVQYDRHVSPFFGIKTSRATFRIIKHNLFPATGEIKQGEFHVNQIGKRTVIDDTKIKADVIIKVVVAVMSTEEMTAALKENPSWFCGEITD
uniref:Matrix protein n=1 Tax=Kenyan potato cytorhabdovirus TaxID=2801326 RepID=A0A7T7FQY8_9RHAB|nr:matrix protein [Kenyan potato cytorhabdovirus]